MMSFTFFAVGFLAGCAATYFVARNNRKYIDRALNADDELRARMDRTVKVLKGKAKEAL
jgi:hypothetical protein